MIIDLQRRIAECGRIRIGQQVPVGQNGKTRPVKLGTFRITSADRARVDQAAAIWGGTVGPWQAPSGPQWEVVTDTDTLDVIVPPSEMAFSQHYEQWSAGGCKRRCDGVTESIGDRPCPCDPEARSCAIHTRLSVMLADLPGLGVWRLDTSGWYAAIELGGAVQVVQATARRGTLLPAKLRLERRQVKRTGADGKPETRNFAVPVLDIGISPRALLGTAALATPGRPEIGGGTGMLTPVPPDPSPPPSIADQVAAPTQRPRRAGTKAITPSGRDRRSNPTPPAADPPHEETGGDAPGGEDRMSQPQQGKLFALLREADVGDRHAYASERLGRVVASFGELTSGDARRLIDDLERLATAGADDQPQADASR